MSFHWFSIVPTIKPNAFVFINDSRTNMSHDTHPKQTNTAFDFTLLNCFPPKENDISPSQVFCVFL